MFNIDPRPAKAGWMPGKYFGKCRECGNEFSGAKRCSQCADCAYGPEQSFASAMGERIHGRREALGMTLDDLAAKSGITKSYAWELDTGKAKSPGADLVGRVAAALEVTFGYLVGEIELQASIDLAFQRRYLAMPEATRAQVRAIADVLARTKP